MKKTFISLIAAAVIAASALISGCSCAGDEQLSLDITLAPETLTYKVEYRADDMFKKDAALDNLFTPEYGTGSFKTVCKKIVDRAGIESDIKDLLKDTDMFEISTEFAIDLTLTIGDDVYPHTEKITTTVYTASSGMSLAPLWAKEEAEYFEIYANDKEAAAYIVKTETETFYNQDTFRSTKYYKRFKPTDAITEDWKAQAETIDTDGKYSFRSVIDNAELIFALRGVSPSLTDKAYKSISVMSPVYNKAEAVKITNEGAAAETLTINYNGTPITENIKYNNLNFLHDSAKTSGTMQYIRIQTEGAGDIPNLSLPLKYTMPLIVYGNFVSMGSMVFTLTDVER